MRDSVGIWGIGGDESSGRQVQASPVPQEDLTGTRRVFAQQQPWERPARQHGLRSRQPTVVERTWARSNSTSADCWAGAAPQRDVADSGWNGTSTVARQTKVLDANPVMLNMSSSVFFSGGYANSQIYPMIYHSPLAAPCQAEYRPMAPMAILKVGILANSEPRRTGKMIACPGAGFEAWATQRHDDAKLPRLRCPATAAGCGLVCPERTAGKNAIGRVAWPSAMPYKARRPSEDRSSDRPRSS